METIASEDKLQKKGLVLLTLITLCVIAGVCGMDILFCGDSYSDLNVLVSGKNFAEYGFLKLHFLPVHMNTPPSDTPAYYLHYPPISNIFNGMLRKIGIQSIFVYRFIAGIASLIGVVCLYKVISRFTGCFTALCGSLFFVTSRYFFQYSCSIHSHAYNIMYLGLFLVFFFKAIDNGRTRHWIGCWIVLFLCSLTSYEFILFLSAIAGIYIIFSGKLKKHYLALIFLATSPVAAVALHLLQNCWAIGIEEALADNLGFSSRHGGLVPQRFKAMAKLPFLFHARTTDFFCFSWLALLAIAGLCPLLLKKIKNNMNIGAMLWATLIATGLWYIFMPSHAFVHTHTVGQFAILVIITIGVLISTLWKIMTNPQYDKTIRSFALSILLVIAGLQSYTVAKKMYQHTQNYSKGKMIRDVAKLLPENSGILINKQLAGPYMTYYSGRPVSWGSESSEIANKIERLKSITSERLDKFLFVYGNNDEYLKDDLFIELASTCPGYRKNFGFQNKNITRPFFLFDLRPIVEPGEDALSKARMTEQLKGNFPKWN